MVLQVLHIVKSSFLDYVICQKCGNIDYYKKDCADGHRCKKCGGDTLPGNFLQAGIK